jgi:hypothetical protein
MAPLNYNNIILYNIILKYKYYIILYYNIIYNTKFTTKKFTILIFFNIYFKNFNYFCKKKKIHLRYNLLSILLTNFYFPWW